MSLNIVLLEKLPSILENEKFHEILDIFEDLIKDYKSIIKNEDLEGFKKLFFEALEYSKEDNHFKNL